MGGAVTGDLAKGLPKGHDGTGPAAASDGMRPGVWGNRLNLDRWVPYRSAGAVSCRVFCFPHTAGNATFYRPLRHAVLAFAFAGHEILGCPSVANGCKVIRRAT